MSDKQQNRERTRSERGWNLSTIEPVPPTPPDVLNKAARYLKRTDAEDLADMLGLENQ